MPILNPQDTEFLKKEFSEKLKQNVKLIFFKSEKDCLYCKEAKGLLSEIASLSDKISIIEHDFDGDREIVEKYKIKRAPGTVIEGEVDYGLRFYGLPAGHEFMTLIHAIINVSSKTIALSEKTKEKLKEITRPFTIQVFVTPT